MTAVTPVTTRPAQRHPITKSDQEEVIVTKRNKMSSKKENRSLTRSTKSAMEISTTVPATETEMDLIPAGLIKPRDGLPVISPHYTKMAIPGIFSHWVTENLLAMARPNNNMITKAGLLDKFEESGIKSIVNLQMPGEHASCGPKLHASGFSYDPNEFMKRGIFFYNFAWKDYGEAPVTSILDMVKVLSFATNEGKVAVHCHAGLGRTGVLIACYLVYYLRVRANDALRYVRLKRPGSVQTRKQIECVKEFEAFFLPQCLVFRKDIIIYMKSDKATRPPGDPDRKAGRFSVEQHLKRQRTVIHGFEARSLKYIPKIVFRLCERLLKLCKGGPEYDPAKDNFIKHFLAYKIDNKSSKLLPFKDPRILQRTPSDSMVGTRRSSRSIFLSTDDEESSNELFPGSRSESETSSYIHSCSSVLSGVDDKKFDDLLGDGIHDQPLNENQVVRELASHEDHQKAVAQENLPKATPQAIFEALIDAHGEKIRSEDGMWATDSTIKFKQYKSDLNIKLSAWDSIESESNLFILTALLFDWLEHLKAPVVDKDSITYLVIHCDNTEEAMKRLPKSVTYVVEYLVRFVARLQPLERDKSELIMQRLMASLTHQSVVIDDIVHPSGRKFPKLRGGTAESTSKFMMKMFDQVLASSDRSSKNSSGFNSLNASNFSTSTSLALQERSLVRQDESPVNNTSSNEQQSASIGSGSAKRRQRRDVGSVVNMRTSTASSSGMSSPEQNVNATVIKNQNSDSDDDDDDMMVLNEIEAEVHHYSEPSCD